jgi:alpha-tubulin suppressor-like RCC1 family protein
VAEHHEPVVVQGVDDATQIAKNGWSSTCARRRDGTVWCWGEYNGGALGVDPARCIPHPTWKSGAFACAPSPVRGLSRVAQVAQSNNGACARLEDGTVRCWGSNLAGELGTSEHSPPGPVAVAGLDRVASIAMGQDHACALRTDRTVWCWGGNQWGALGDGTNTGGPTPREVHGLTDVVEIDLGQNHSCARTQGGDVWCWGSNVFGELGGGRAASETCIIQAASVVNRLPCRTTPALVVDLPRVTQIAAGASTTCARAASGEVRCWPNPDERAPRATPYTREDLSPADRISLGNYRGCAWISGDVRCWDDGKPGELTTLSL